MANHHSASSADDAVSRRDSDVKENDAEKQDSDSNQDKEAENAKKEWIKTNPASPRNWPTWKKWNIILGLNFYTIIVFICSTGFVTDWAKEHYSVNDETAVLGQSMFILGIAIGPMFLAPLSEVHGRQPVYITGIFLFSILQIPTALSPTFAGVILSRLIAGGFAGLPLSNVGASAADVFPLAQTAWPITVDA